MAHVANSRATRATVLWAVIAVRLQETTMFPHRRLSIFDPTRGTCPKHALQSSPWYICSDFPKSSKHPSVQSASSNPS
ncbi:hypothetical protein A0H81_00792 [Grifola frondosa]|uniref:Uncharacterized protein n=1 Tax=Grifola frondosa TaxID=5627 RepID=A0A1C7MRF6_GRIFR|nr:hypothetical protein A0H81_00792 [Grifola frondosa]